MQTTKKQQRLIDQKRNPLLNESIRLKSNSNITKLQSQGVFLVDLLSKQEKYDLMMTILDKECEERSNLEVNILTQIVSDIRFFRDMKSSTTDADETCFKLCKYMQGFFLQKNEVLFRQGDKGDTFWIIIKGEVRIYKNTFVKIEKDPQNANCHQQSDQVGDHAHDGNGEDTQQVEEELVRLGSGNCFGEFALDPNKSNRRQASVETTIDTFFGFIKADKIMDIIQKINNSASFIQAFSRINLLKGYPYEILKQFYDICEETQVSKNSIIYDIHDLPQFVYFVKEGEFSIYTDREFKNEFHQVEGENTTDKNGQGDAQIIKMQKQKKIFTNTDRGKFVQLKILGQGECFGEEEILKKRGTDFYRIYRVVCSSESGTLYQVPKKQLIRLLSINQSVLKSMITQIKNKEQARLYRLLQLQKTRAGNEEIGIDGQIRVTDDVKIQHQFNQESALLVNSSKKKKPEYTLQKTVKMAKNCDLAENIFKEDDHNYLIFHSQIASNQFLPKNPKLRKEDAGQEYEEQGDQQKLLIEEIDKNRFLRMMELQNGADTNHREMRSTLLYEEGLKKKKPTSQQKVGSVFEVEYLKDFSQKYNIPQSELNVSHRIAKRENSGSSSDANNESFTKRRNTADFLVKANQQKNQIREQSKSIFYNNINGQQEGRGHSPSITVQSHIKDEINELALTPKRQRPSGSPLFQGYSSLQSSPRSTFSNQDSSLIHKVPPLQLDEIKSIQSNFKIGSEHINNIYQLQKPSNLNTQLPSIISPVSKSFMNNTPKTQKVPNEIFKFMKPEYNNSPITRPKKVSLNENQIKQGLKRQTSINNYIAQGQQSNQVIEQSLNQNQDTSLYQTKDQSFNQNFQENTLKSIKQHLRFTSLQQGDFTSSYNQPDDFQPTSCQTERLSLRQSQNYAGSENVSRQVSPTVSITKLMTPTIEPSQQKALTHRQITNKNAQQSTFYINNTIKQINQSTSSSQPTILLKSVAENLFQSNKPSAIRIKKFQLSNTFKNQDKTNFGIRQSQDLLNANKLNLQNRFNSNLN